MEFIILVEGGVGVTERVAQKGDTVWNTQIGDEATVKRWVDAGIIAPVDGGASTPEPDAPAVVDPVAVGRKSVAEAKAVPDAPVAEVVGTDAQDKPEA